MSVISGAFATSTTNKHKYVITIVQLSSYITNKLQSECISIVRWPASGKWKHDRCYNH